MNDGQYISILQPIANAKEQLGISHATEDYFFLMKAGEAERIIGSRNTLVRKQKELYITDGMVELPPDLHTFVSLRLSDGTYPFCARKSFFKFDENNLNSIEEAVAYTMDFEDGVVYFSSDVTADSCEISYVGYNTDEDGFPRIHQDHEVAIMHYLCFMYMLRDAERFSGTQLSIHQRMWGKRCDQARAKANREHPIYDQYDKLIWNNMLRPHRQRF